MQDILSNADFRERQLLLNTFLKDMFVFSIFASTSIIFSCTTCLGAQLPKTSERGFFLAISVTFAKVSTKILVMGVWGRATSTNASVSKKIKLLRSEEFALANMAKDGVMARQFHVCTDKQSLSFAEQTTKAEREREERRRYLGTRCKSRVRGR